VTAAPAAGRRRALVIGGGIAGMCTARALSDVYDEVVVVESDRYPEQAVQRRGVPQSRMYHTLLERGRREIEALFPGFQARLEEHGAPRIGFGFNAAVMTPRGWSAPAAGLVMRNTNVSRVLLESTMRELFLTTPNVEIRQATKVLRLLAEPRDGGLQCTGAQVSAVGHDATEDLTADLVIDASGRSTKAPEWLDELGVPLPPEETLDPRLTYAGRWMRLRPEADWPSKWWWTHGVFIQRVPPRDVRGAHLMRQENDLWLLTMVAGNGELPPNDEREIAEFAAALRSPLIAEMLDLFEPHGPVSRFRLPISRWRHYEDWAARLDGFVAMADAVCVNNPNQGQGMTVAAAEASLLRRCAQESTDPTTLPKQFFAEQARFIESPWRIAVGNDLRFDTVEGPRPRSIRTFNWYRRQLARSTNRKVRQHLGDIDGLVTPVGRLYAPTIAARAALNRTTNTLLRRRDDFDAFGPLPPALPTPSFT
jgi:2-polyprenyl-6-methoxyphenol hydroxylase-like FAD-dependent oxidoreductase